MFHVIGRALGADGSTMYRTAAGDFFLYPVQGAYPGWLLLDGVGAPVLRRYSHRDGGRMARHQCLRFLEQWLRDEHGHTEY
jgi:hypothetical protein